MARTCERCGSGNLEAVDENVLLLSTADDWIAYECDDCGHFFIVTLPSAPEPAGE